MLSIKVAGQHRRTTAMVASRVCSGAGVGASDVRRWAAGTLFRSAARTVADITGLKGLSHASVHKETILCGQHIEDEQLRIGSRAGRSKRESAKHLRVAIDGTVDGRCD